MIDDLKQVNKQVEWVLNEYPDTRDSDKDLILKVMELYYKLDLSYMQKQAIRNAPSFESIRRTRQKFQEGGSFKASEEVEDSRKVEETKVRGKHMTARLL